MNNFRDSLFKTLGNLEESEKSKVDLWLSENYEQIIERMSLDLLSDLNEKQVNYVDEIDNELQGFHSRLMEIWKKPIRRLTSLIAMCVEVGSEFYEECTSSSDIEQLAKHDLLNKLHVRSLQISNEILCLIKGGFADGAFARWRSLHETNVIIALLSRNHVSLAIRYVDFQVVARLKAAENYNKNCGALGLMPIDEHEVESYRRDRNAMRAKYGKGFTNENGWAAEILKKEKVNFKDIEEAVSMDHFRPYYIFASKNIHSGIDSVGYKLGLSLSGQEILLAGPSDQGFIDPMQNVSYSLVSATCLILDIFPNEERSIMKNVLWEWHGLLVSEALEAEKKLQQTGRNRPT